MWERPGHANRSNSSRRIMCGLLMVRFLDSMVWWTRWLRTMAGLKSWSVFLGAPLQWSLGFCKWSGFSLRNGRTRVGVYDMAKEVSAQIKLQIPAGKANPAPPVGPSLGQHGVNIMEFCKQFNAKTQKEGDSIIPVVITVYKDRSFTFVMKTPPASDLLKKAAGVIKGSGVPQKDKVGKITKAQLREIAQKKMTDLNAVDLEGAIKIIEGTACSMGVVVQG